MLMARSRATYSTQMCRKQSKMCVIPSPLTGATYVITILLPIFVGEHERGVPVVGVFVSGRVRYGRVLRAHICVEAFWGGQQTTSGSSLPPLPCFLNQGLRAWGLLIRLLTNQGSSSARRLCNVEIIRRYHCAWLFTRIVKIDIRSSCLYSKRFTD